MVGGETGGSEGGGDCSVMVMGGVALHLSFRYSSLAPPAPPPPLPLQVMHSIDMVKPGDRELSWFKPQHGLCHAAALRPNRFPCALAPAPPTPQSFTSSPDGVSASTP